MASTAVESAAAAIRIFRPSAKTIPVVGPIVEGVLESVLELYKHVELVKANRKKAKELVERIGLIAYSMAKHSHLENLSPEGRVEMQSHLRVLESIIAKTHPCIKLLQSRTILQRVARPTADDSELKDLNLALDRAIEQFHIGATLRTISKMFQDQRTEELEFLRKILRPVTAALYDSSTAPSACLEGTRTDVLDAMFDWTFSDSPQRVFWLSGMAGTGKSTIAKTICQRIAKHIGSLDFDDPDVHLVTFFITHNTTDRRSPFRVLHTLAFYVCSAIPSFRTFLHDALSSTPELIDKAMEVQMEKLLAQPLASSCSETQTKIILVIDAFDECDKIDRCEGGKFLPSLLSIISQSEPRIRLIFTSRNEHSIANMFAQCRDERTLRLHEIERHTVDQDICTYLTHELSGLGITSDMLASLVKTADGLFVYAATVARFLQDMDAVDGAELIRSIIQRPAPLEQTSDSTIPPFTPLDDMYCRILLGALPPGVGEPHQRIYARVVYSVVISLALVAVPVSAQTLAVLIGQDLCRVDTILKRLASVLASSSSTEPIRFLHATFREYVLDPERCGAQFPGVDVSDSLGHGLREAALAHRCLVVLNSHLHEGICGIGNPCSDLLDHERLGRCISQELVYACLYWDRHFHASCARSSLPDALLKEIDKELAQFCHSHLLHWIEALSTLDHMDTSGRDYDIYIGEELSLVLLSKWWASKEIISMPPTYAAMREVYDIVNKDYKVISAAPLHIYTLVQIYGSNDSVRDQLSRTRLTRVQCLRQPERIRTSSTLRPVSVKPDYVFAVTQDGSHLFGIRRYDQVSFGTTSKVDLLHLESGNRLPLPGQPCATRRDTCEPLSWSCCTAISRCGIFIAYDVSGNCDSDIQLWILRSNYLSASCHVNGWVIALTFSEDASCIYAVVLETRGYTSTLSCRKFSLQSGILSEEFEAVTVLYSFDDADEHWPTAAPGAPNPHCCEDWRRQACRHKLRASDLHKSLRVKMTATSRGITVAVAVTAWSDIRVWQLSSTRSCVVLQGFTRPVRDIELSRGGDNRHLLASCSEFDDDGIILWDVQSGCRIATFPLVGNRAVSLALSYDGALLAVFGTSIDRAARSTPNLTLWDTSAPQRILGQYSLRPHDPEEGSWTDFGKVALLPPHRSSHEPRLAVWDTMEEVWVHSLGQTSNALWGRRLIHAAVFSGDGRAFATVTPAGMGIDIWKTDDASFLHSLDLHAVIGHQFQQLAWFDFSLSADDRHIVVFAHCCMGGNYGFYKLRFRRRSSGGWITDYQHVLGLETSRHFDALSCSSSWDVLAYTERHLPGYCVHSREAQVVTVRELYDGGKRLRHLRSIVVGDEYRETTSVQLSPDGRIVAVFWPVLDPPYSRENSVRLWLVGQTSDQPYRIIPVPTLYLNHDLRGTDLRLGFLCNGTQVWCCTHDGYGVYDIESSTELDNALTTFGIESDSNYDVDWLTYTSPAHPMPRRVFASRDMENFPMFAWFDKTVVIGPCRGELIVLRVDEGSLSLEP